MMSNNVCKTSGIEWVFNKWCVHYYSPFPFFLLSLSLAFITPLRKVSLDSLHMLNDYVWWFPDGAAPRPELHKMSKTGG